MSNLNRYQQYLTLDGVAKAFERAGVKMSGNVTLHQPSEYNRRKFEELMSGEAEVDQADSYWYYAYIFANVDVAVTLDLELAYGVDDAEKQRAREAALFALMDAMPKALAVRHRGEAYLVGRMGTGTFEVRIGRALCEQVVVGTKKVKRPANPEAVAKIMEAVEHIEVDEPILEWRCNDAELMAGRI